MKVCIFNYEQPSKAGGAGTASFSISKELVKIGVDVHYIVMSEDKYRESISEGVKIYHTRSLTYGMLSLIPRVIQSHLIFSVPYTIEVQKLLNKIQPDVLISFGTFPAFQTYIHNKFSKKTIPYVLSFRHNPLLRKITFLPMWLKSSWKINPLIKSAISFTSPSLVLSQNLEPYIKREIITIPNGIDKTLYYPKLNNSTQKNKTHVLLCLSRLAPEKRVEDAIMAMPLILEKNPSVILRIVGDGPDREDLEKLSINLNIRENVEFIGHVPHEEIIKEYHKASIFLLPSDNEGFPNTFLEAISCGLPVITTPVGDLEYIVPDAGNGFLVNFHSPSEIADAVCKIISDDEIYNKFSEMSIGLSRKYSWKEVALLYHNHLKDILDEKHYVK